MLYIEGFIDVVLLIYNVVPDKIWIYWDFPLDYG